MPAAIEEAVSFSWFSGQPRPGRRQNQPNRIFWFLWYYLQENCYIRIFNKLAKSKALDHLFVVAAQFTPQGQVLDVRPYGNGNVHDTFLVTIDSAAAPHFILQRLNTRVFRRPELVMANLRTCTEHVRGRLARAALSPGRRWEVPRVLPARDGRDYFIDAAGLVLAGLELY